MSTVACKVLEFSSLNGAEEEASEREISGLSEELFPRHVLVVDDEPLIRWSIAESLADLGLDVEQAPDAASALRTVTTAAHPFEVVVLDLAQFTRRVVPEPAQTTARVRARFETAELVVQEADPAGQLLE